MVSRIRTLSLALILALPLVGLSAVGRLLPLWAHSAMVAAVVSGGLYWLFRRLGRMADELQEGAYAAAWDRALDQLAQVAAGDRMKEGKP